MSLESIYAAFEDFRLARYGRPSETAVIRLDPGETTDAGWNSSELSEQMVMVLEGEMVAEIGDDRRVVGKGATLVIGEGVPRRLTNEGETVALAFAVFAPESQTAPKGISA